MYILELVFKLLNNLGEEMCTQSTTPVDEKKDVAEERLDEGRKPQRDSKMSQAEFVIATIVNPRLYYFEHTCVLAILVSVFTALLIVVGAFALVKQCNTVTTIQPLGATVGDETMKCEKLDIADKAPLRDSQENSALLQSGIEPELHARLGSLGNTPNVVCLQHRDEDSDNSQKSKNGNNILQCEWPSLSLFGEPVSNSTVLSFKALEMQFGDYDNLENMANDCANNIEATDPGVIGGARNINEKPRSFQWSGDAADYPKFSHGSALHDAYFLSYAKFRANIEDKCLPDDACETGIRSSQTNSMVKFYASSRKRRSSTSGNPISHFPACDALKVSSTWGVLETNAMMCKPRSFDANCFRDAARGHLKAIGYKTFFDSSELFDFVRTWHFELPLSPSLQATTFKHTLDITATVKGNGFKLGAGTPAKLRFRFCTLIKQQDNELCVTGNVINIEPKFIQDPLLSSYFTEDVLTIDENGLERNEFTQLNPVIVHYTLWSLSQVLWNPSFQTRMNAMYSSRFAFCEQTICPSFAASLGSSFGYAAYVEVFVTTLLLLGWVFVRKSSAIRPEFAHQTQFQLLRRAILNMEDEKIESSDYLEEDSPLRNSEKETRGGVPANDSAPVNHVDQNLLTTV